MGTSRHLTHVELLHRPGERELAQRLFDLLGCRTVDRGGHWFTSLIEPAGEPNFSDNVCYGSEVGQPQWEFEQALTANASIAGYRDLVRDRPQISGHFGFRVPTEADLEEIVARVREAGHSHPEFRGRVGVDRVYRPGEPDCVAPNMVQAFIWTDIVSTGLLCLGQHIEVQWHLDLAG